MRTRKVVMTALIIIVVVAAITGWLVIRGGFSARDNPSWIEKAVARTARSMAVPTTAREMKDPVQNTPENLSEAEAHWADHCAFCHGNNGSGVSTVMSLISW